MNSMKQWLKNWAPWWMRMGVKIALSRLPVRYTFWRRFGLFRHGYMDESAYSLSVFEAHVRLAGFSMQSLTGKVILEMGPGDSVATAIIAHALGARAILIDAGRYASGLPLMYQPLCHVLSERGLPAINVNQFDNLEAMLDACGALYLTNGARAWEAIAAQSVDLIFSQAVLEHVRLHEFEQIQSHCIRVLKPLGVASHRVDLKDHLGGRLNNLRFSRKLWESAFFVNSGFYTNRLRISSMLEVFANAGFCVECGRVERWRKLPTARKNMASEFGRLSDDELLVSGFDVLLRRSTMTGEYQGKIN